MLDARILICCDVFIITSFFSSGSSSGRQSNITIINFKKIMQIKFHSDCNQVKCSIIYMLFCSKWNSNSTNKRSISNTRSRAYNLMNIYNIKYGQTKSTCISYVFVWKR